MIFSPILLSFSSSDWIIFIDLSSLLTLFCIILLLSHNLVIFFFHFRNLIFKSKISFWIDFSLLRFLMFTSYNHCFLWVIKHVYKIKFKCHNMLICTPDSCWGFSLIKSHILLLCIFIAFISHQVLCLHCKIL